MPSDSKVPSDWMRHAFSDLEIAKIPISGKIRLESLCYHAQQAVEKSIKAVLLRYEVTFPKVHSIERLIDLLPENVERTDDLKASASLTRYAAMLRYPGEFEEATREHYDEAVRLAEAVVEWAKHLIE